MSADLSIVNTCDVRIILTAAMRQRHTKRLSNLDKVSHQLSGMTRAGSQILLMSSDSSRHSVRVSFSHD